MARIKRMAWGTVARWLESAATCAARFSDRMLKGFVIRELQADEIRTFIGAKKRVIWVLTNLEVWSRLWISVEIGRRNFRNIKRVMLDTLQRGRVEHRFLFTTDGFEVYEWVARDYSPVFASTVKSSRGAGRIGWSGSIVDCFWEHKGNWRNYSFTQKILALSTPDSSSATT